MDSKQERLNRCPDALALLPAYVEGELTGRDMARIKGHLEICGACRLEEAAFRTALGAFAGLECVESPPDLYYGFAAKLDASMAHSRRQMKRFKFASAALCLLLVVGVSASPLVRLILPRKAEITVVTPKPPQQVVVVPPRVESATEHSSAPHAAPAVPTEEPLTRPVERRLETPISSDPPRRVASKSRRYKVARRTEGFLDVRDSFGNSVNVLRANRTGSAGMHAQAVHPAGFVSDRDERVQIGEKVTEIHTAYRMDEEGRRTGVDINIGTSATPPQ